MCSSDSITSVEHETCFKLNNSNSSTKVCSRIVEFSVLQDVIQAAIQSSEGHCICFIGRDLQFV